MTLLELLLVIFVLALVLGGGLGVFANLDLGKRQAAGLVRNVLRSAQNTAIASAAPARVRIDKARNALWAESLTTIGTEHFDEHGFVGACFRPAGELGAKAEIPLERDPACDFTHGFALECAILRESESNGRVFTMGGSESPTVALEINTNGALRARMRTRAGDSAASDQPGGSVILQSEPELVPVGRWVKVRMRYDRARFELLLDGALVDAEEEESFVWRVDEPLVLSDPSLPFPGRIDNLVIAAMVVGDPSFLPETVLFAPDVPPVVQFAASGGLDRERHRDPPRIGLDYKDGSREIVTVGFYGTVE
jgi:type II secretory pathway pseudopilin PulG